MKYLNKWQLLLTFSPALLVLLGALIVHKTYDISIISMTRDVTTLGNIHPLSGFISSIGILIWTAAASISLITAIILSKEKEKFNFLLYSALFTFYLLLDDLFLIHERSGGWLRGGEKAIVILLGFTLLLQLILFYKTIYKTSFFMLLLAIGFLFFSVVIDSIQPYFWERGNCMHFLKMALNGWVLFAGVVTIFTHLIHS